MVDLDPLKENLSSRSRDIFDLLVAGHTEKQISGRLGISQHTVHSHIKRIYRHFEVGSHRELLAKIFLQLDGRVVRREIKNLPTAGIGGMPDEADGPTNNSL